MWGGRGRVESLDELRVPVFFSNPFILSALLLKLNTRPNVRQKYENLHIINKISI